MPGAALVPLPLTPGRESAITLSQAIPVRFTLSLLDDVTTDLAPYLGSLPEADRDRLRAVLERRRALADTRREIDEHRDQLQDVASRNAELRETLRALPATPAQAALRAQTARQLQESMARYEALSRGLAERTTRAAALRAELVDAARTLQIGAAPAP